MSVATARDPNVARTKRPSEETPPTVPIKVARDVATKAKIVASDRGIDLAKYVSDILRTVVDKDWGKIVKRIDTEGKGE